ncbi:DUF1592 domain-containing protein [Aureliella helgolandensis]|uniref:Planctomycete cytochrome C n=1 Tax=Aureliella helgolandensis TaxID=2527968 RepID=A0A518GAG3_9BACT|nr:DUF1592 domain-containing protein [Aureliella helgolandensis]QDV25586.1 Planctomycete cytochrome C [Aureliella helgolandensis]
MTSRDLLNGVLVLRQQGLAPWLCLMLTALHAPAAQATETLTSQLAELNEFVSAYCLDCHSPPGAEGGLELATFDFSTEQFAEQHFDSRPWETILRRIETRQMPPPDAERPEESQYRAISESLSSILERRALEFPELGRVGGMRRMTRLEYQYAIRDLLQIQIDAESLLPKDESSHGFDNITVEELSPTHLNRYLSAAQKISRAALGGLGDGPIGVTIRLPADRTQEEHVAGLPFGTRGGTVFEQHFPQTGEYEIELKLTRDRDEKVEGLDQSHQIDILVDRAPVHQFTVAPPDGSGDWTRRDYTHSDSHLKAKIRVEAGQHTVGVTFPKTFSSIVEIKRQPFDASFNRHRHPRRTPAIYQISIVGPFAPQGPGRTPSRDLVLGEFVNRPSASRADAHSQLQRLVLRAYRRPVTSDDMEPLMRFFDEGYADGGFEQGMESALTAILVNPNFLFRIEQDRPSQSSSGSTSPIDDYELASRLSFFLWSSLPDAELLNLAENDRLHQDTVLREQVQRMLASPKSQSLVDNFAAQWLYLRNLDSISPDLRLFPDFDDNLRESFRQETELLFQDVLNNDRSVLELVGSQHTFLNERLATHYGITGVTGSQFRRVEVAPDSHRGGILRHGSVLMVTSYATRTSPTIRGNWVLENIFGTPAPPPPPNIPNLQENNTLAASSVRERLAMHRANPACASCHDLIDPVGFALENFDAVGRWREFEGTLHVDSTGSLPDGTVVSSMEELEAGILERPEIFARTLTEKLMTFALGRALDHHDGPAVRRIVKASQAENFTLSSIITGIALSDPFRKRSRKEP